MRPKEVPATLSAIADAIRWAEEIMEEIKSALAVSLMARLIAQDNRGIPELRETLERPGVAHHPQFRIARSPEEPMNH